MGREAARLARGRLMMRFEATCIREFVVRYATLPGTGRPRGGRGRRDRTMEGRIGGGDETGTGFRVSGRVARTLGYQRERRGNEGGETPLGEGESEFVALNMVDSRIGCAVAGRYGPHHRPAGCTIPFCCIPTIPRYVYPLSF